MFKILVPSFLFKPSTMLRPSFATKLPCTMYVLPLRTSQTCTPACVSHQHLVSSPQLVQPGDMYTLVSKRNRNKNQVLDLIIGFTYLCVLFQVPARWQHKCDRVMVARSRVGCSWVSFFLLRVLPAVVLILLLPSGIATHQKWYQKSRPLPRPSIIIFVD